MILENSESEMGSSITGKMEEMNQLKFTDKKLRAIEEEIKKMLPDREFPLRRHYWYPVLFLYKESVNGADKIFDKPIFGPEDLPSVS